MGDSRSSYECIRNARILENQARLAALGLQKTISELRRIASPAKSVKTHVQKFQKVDYSSIPPRRSPRLNRSSLLPTTPSFDQRIPLRRSSQLRGTLSEPPISTRRRKRRSEDVTPSKGEKKKPKPLPELSPEVVGRRCASKSRGTIYHSVFGICCHFCRQKTLCGEVDCKRCGNFDVDEPCIGKTDCSSCHSSYGVLCRGCLKIRYGEEMEEVRRNKQWMCPHCIEDKGINPHWICNSSLCLRKRKMGATGIAIFRAREMGYKSVAHMLMDELRRAKHR
ncbi:uncharacterized protein LOC127795765 [Diospyros lotus]|uniref:uncharacterized protein LOC127795765 n=1 Tax=Diospyros lotus TaxID=55363 RepID=UPI00225500B2|nr:uncharacterized protein LOC127795765 [Diospyros lotus]